MLPSDHPLRSSSFRRLSMAVLISSAGDWASVVAVAFGVLGFAGVVSLGLVLLAKEVAASLAVLVGGVIADRGERRVVLAWAWSIAGAAQMLTGADLLFIHSIPLAVVCQAMLGAGVAVGRPTSVALTPELVEKSQLAAANGVLGLTRNAVSLIGASVGAALVVGAGAGLAVILDGFSFVAACLLIRSIRASTGRNTMGESNGFLDDLREGETSRAEGGCGGRWPPSLSFNCRSSLRSTYLARRSSELALAVPGPGLRSLQQERLVPFSAERPLRRARGRLAGLLSVLSARFCHPASSWLFSG